MSGLGRNALQSKGEQENKGTTKVGRYRAGQVPKWVEENDEQQELLILDENKKNEVAAPVIVAPGSDPRLQRLAGRTAQGSEDARARRRREVMEQDRGKDGADTDDDDDDDDDDDERIRARRARMRAMQLQAEEREAGAKAGPSGQEEDEDEEDEYSSEYETDSEDENAIQLAKPVFVAKSDRTTIAEGRKNEVQTTFRAPEEVQKRQQDTRALLKQVNLDEYKGDTEQNGFDDIDTDDEKDKQASYEAWKVREFNRLKLELELETGLKLGEDEEKDTLAEPKEKGKWNFMQKYYHKGAFFQNVSDHKLVEENVESVYKRDYSKATGEDKFNLSVLPKVMQVKNFGKRGRTKWTHLVEEDTSKLGDDYDLKKKYKR